MIDAVVCIIVVLLACAVWGLLMDFIGAVVQLARERIGVTKTRTPKGKTHIDMMTKEVKMSEIKTGDRVMVVDDSGICTPPNGTVGTVVIARDEPASICVNFDNVGHNWWVPAEYLELAQTQKQTKCENSKTENGPPFAPGDKVRYTGEGGTPCSPKRGTVGEVVLSARDGTTMVRWPDGTVLLNGAVYEWWAKNESLELVRDEIHVGDIVRMKNIREALALHEEHPSWYPKQSVVGRVVGIEQDWARVEWEAGSVETNSDGNFTWYIQQENIEVVFAKK